MKALVLAVGAITVIGGLVSCTSLSSIDSVSQFNRDTLAIRTYLNQNNISATKLSQGVWFTIDNYAEGIRATYRDTMLVTYKMRLMSTGDIIDQSTTPVSLVLSDLVTGIQYAMPFFQRGSTGRIFIPSAYGYGSGGNGVPANSNLIFEFSLSDVKSYQLRKDTVAIDAFLKANSISGVETDTSGIRYKINSLGTGSMVAITDVVEISLDGRLLQNPSSTVIQTTSSTSYLVSDLVWALQIGLTETGLKEGGSITVYSPSGLAFGTAVTATVPANSNMIFNIQLTKVTHH